jgi:hypothetical protein
VSGGIQEVAVIDLASLCELCGPLDVGRCLTHKSIEILAAGTK